MNESIITDETDMLLNDLMGLLQNKHHASEASVYARKIFDTLNEVIVDDLQENTKAPLMQSLGRLREIEMRLRESLKNLEENREEVRYVMKYSVGQDMERLSGRLMRLDRDIVRTQRSLNKNQEFCIEMMSWLV